MSEVHASSLTKTEDKVRKELVQVFFALVLTQMAVYFTALVQMSDWKGNINWNFLAAWTHLILCFALTVTSWFGWQMSIAKEKPLDDEASVFQGGFPLAVLDILLVGLYFLMVHQIDLKGVSAFPPRAESTADEPSARPETFIMILVFFIYILWDGLNYKLKIRSYRPWPSILCFLLCLLGLVPTSFSGKHHPGVVILTDFYLFCIVFLFRALKRYQKWTIQRPKEVRRAVMFWLNLTIIGTLVSIVLALGCGLGVWFRL